MKWYSSNKDPELDLTKPLGYELGGSQYLLLPQVKNSYIVAGYDWFNVTTGEYSSCMLFESAKAAISARRGQIIRNVSINVC